MAAIFKSMPDKLLHKTKWPTLYHYRQINAVGQGCQLYQYARQIIEVGQGDQLQSMLDKSLP